MCGLGGYVGSGSERVLDAMTKLLVHRGPDAQGTWVGHGVGLAATRLAILDLSPAGNQPMAAPRAAGVGRSNAESNNLEPPVTGWVSIEPGSHSGRAAEVCLAVY